MKVYCVKQYLQYEFDSVVEIFLSEEKAKIRSDELQKQDKYVECYVEEFEVQE
jgi:hypothetical protein